MMHRDRDDSTERQSADVRPVDPELVHPGDDRGSIIVAGGAFGRWVAVAVAGIVECDRAPFAAEMLELRMPHRLVGTDSMKEDNRGCVAGASFHKADLITIVGDHPGHAPHLGSLPPLALASLHGAADGQ